MESTADLEREREREREKKKKKKKKCVTHSKCEIIKHASLFVQREGGRGV